MKRSMFRRHHGHEHVVLWLLFFVEVEKQKALPHAERTRVNVQVQYL